MTIYYHKGDATKPIGPEDERKLIIHVCNNVGAWGAGFVLAVTKNLGRGPEQAYRSGIEGGTLKLGVTQFVDVSEKVVVANMVAQTLDYRQGPNIKYDALHECLTSVEQFARVHGTSIHGPRFGAGLAGGKWNIIEAIVEEVLGDFDVHIYDYEGPGSIQWR